VKRIVADLVVGAHREHSLPRRAQGTAVNLSVLDMPGIDSVGAILFR